LLGGSHSPDSVELKQGGGELGILKAESWKEDEKRTDLKYGKFTKEEDEILREAVAQYIQVSYCFSTHRRRGGREAEKYIR
jgi:hypothetical protein